MKDRGALSLLRGAGRASGRFMAEVAVSFIATLCVTLVLSGWFHPGGAEVAPPGEVSSSPASNASRSADASAQVKTTAVQASADLPLLVERDVARKEKSASAPWLEPVSVISASHPRSASHAAKTAPHNAQAPCAPACTGHASTEASARMANNEPPLRLAGADSQSATSASTSEEEHRPSVFGLSLPAVPVHAVLTRPWRPVLQGASSVTELITGLAGK